MAHNPQGVAFGGLVTLHNFTHYDTDDLVRVLEAPLTARRRAGLLEKGSEPNEKVELHISYSSSLPGGAKAKLIGSSWRHNGIRVLPPLKMYDNPIEALADTSKEMPLVAVQNLLGVAQRLFGGRACWSGYQRRDIDLDTLALGVRVAIHDKVAAKMPRGYRRRAFAVLHSHRGARGAYYRLCYAVTALSNARKGVARFHYHARAADIQHMIPDELRQRLDRLHEEAESIRREFFTAHTTIEEQAR